MNTNLYDAHAQWANRPADERFKTLAELHDAVNARDKASQDGRISLDTCRFALQNKEIVLTGDTKAAKLTHWSAGQLLQRLGVPRDLIEVLSPEVAEAVLNDRLLPSIRDEKLERRQRVLLQQGEGLTTLRALHSSRYERLWDSEVTRTLMEYLPPGWRNPVAFAGGRWGAPLEPSGLYAGDRDMFAFFIDGGDWETHPVGTFDVDGDAFHRGFYVWNSEVGAKSFGFSSFMFRVVCGNNIVWGATDISTVRARHAGNARLALRGFRRFLDVMNTQGTPDQFATAVREAKREIAVAITSDRGNTLDRAFAKFKGKFTQTEITDALDKGITEAQKESRPVDGSRWFWLQGLTAVARSKQNADEKIKMEEDASKLLLVTR